MPDATRDITLFRLRTELERARREHRTMTYLQAADAVGVKAPHRIQKLARLVERLLEQDAQAGRLPIGALVVSRARSGLPAPGFFDRAFELGIFDGQQPATFHAELLSSLFEAAGSH